MFPSRSSSRWIPLVLTTLLAAGCGDDLTTGNSVLPNGAAEDIGITARDEVEAALSALTLTSSLDIVGQLRVQDPAETQAGFGYEGTLTGLRTRFTTAGDDVIYDVTRNGTRIVSGSVSGLLLSADLQVIRTFAGKPDAAIDKQWTLTYTPEIPLQINTPLPGGTLDFAGTMDWTRGTEHYVLTVTTPAPLHYNDGCIDTVQRIDAGEMHLVGTFTDGGGNPIGGNVRVRWNDCGSEPSIDFVVEE